MTVPSAGDYDVYARWTSHSNRASNAKYTVNHSGGSSVITVNQKINGGQDNLLGTFTLNAGSTTITLSDNADGYVIADLVQAVPIDAQPNTATWALDIPTAGDYEIYARWTSHANRATNAPYTIQHATGNTTVTVDQQTNGNQYNLLGTFTFNAGTTHFVTLTDQADGFVIADGIQVVPVGAAPNTATWALNIPGTGDYEVYAKWTAHANRASDAPYVVHHANGNTTINANQQADGGVFNLLGTFTFNAGTSHSIDLTDEANGFVIADSVQVVSVGAGPNMATWQPMLTQAGEYEVFAKWTSHINRATDAKYIITHTGGTNTITVNQQTNGGTFNSLGTFTLDSNSNVQLTDIADGFVIADAIKIVQTSTPPPMTVAGVFFYHTDHLGTSQLLNDNTQTVVWKADYDPFGSATVTVETIENNLRFAGQYFDQETGLHYNYFRYYDPSIGRYITSDPIGLAGGLNTYVYANLNPINFTDPLGLVSPIGEFGTLPLGQRVIPENKFNKRRQCEIQCLGSVFGSGLGIANAATGVGALPVPKDAIGVPTIRGASPVTNPVSGTGLLLGKKDPKIGRQILGTNRVFGLAGRLNLAAFVGLTAFDLVSLELCTQRCENEEDAMACEVK